MISIGTSIQKSRIQVFLSVHGTFSKIDHIWGHKSSLGKFKKIVFISSIFSDHSAKRLDIICRNKTVKIINIWWLNNTLLYNQEFTNKTKRKLNILRKKMTMKYNDLKPMGFGKSGFNKQFIAIQSYFTKWEEHQIHNLNLHLKEVEKEPKKKKKKSKS